MTKKDNSEKYLKNQSYERKVLLAEIFGKFEFIAEQMCRKKALRYPEYIKGINKAGENLLGFIKKLKSQYENNNS